MVSEYPQHRRGRWKEFGIVCAILVVGLAIALAVVIVVKNKELEEKAVSPCASGDENIDLSEPENPPVFADLTTREIQAVMTYLHKQNDLNLAKPHEISVASSYIYLMELNVPAKSTVLNYLDNNGAEPERHAKVVTFRGDLPTPGVMEYEVGPLPNPRFHNLVYRNGSSSVPFEYRPHTFPELSGVYVNIFIGEIEAKGRRLLLESFDATFIDCGMKCLTFFPTSVSTSNYGRITRNFWFWIHHNIDFYTLHPLDFKILVNLDSVNTSEYKVMNVWYNQRLFSGMDELMSAYDNNTVEKIVMTFPQENADTFSTMNLRGDPFPKKHLRSPIQIEPDGKRYSVKGQHVEYMGWSFDYRMSTTTGPMLFDVRYRGERIAYEISLQEIAVFYSGYNPAQRFSDFTDSVGLLGILSKALIPGSDCPDHSVFLPARHVTEGTTEPFVFQNALCLFEQTTGVPLRRHHSYGRHGGWFYGGLMDDVLTLRAILSLANYDYIIDFIFHQNGAVEVKTISTGYILTSVYSADESKYGFHLHERLVGNVHHHMFNYKVDIDILGTLNRFETLDFGVEDTPNQQFSSAPSAQTYNQINFQSNLKTTEKSAAYHFNFDSPKYLLFNNDKFKTKNRVPRSYRVLVSGVSKQTLPEERGQENSITWARYQMAVTKYKESERQSSSFYSIWDAIDPVNRFQSFIDDDESIVDEDLVAWVTVGIHHIPHTEDLPVTPTPGGHLQFFLLPYNYFTEDPSMASRNAVLMELKQSTDNSGPTVEVNRYGYDDKVTCIGQSSNFYERLQQNPELVFSTSPIS